MRNLSQLLVQVGRLNASRHISISVVDVDVPRNENGLCKFDDFHSDEEGDRNHISEEQDPGEERFEEYLNIGIPSPG